MFQGSGHGHFKGFYGHIERKCRRAISKLQIFSPQGQSIKLGFSKKSILRSTDK